MANTRNFIVLDTETTGLDPHQGHEIVQLSAKAINCHDLEEHHAGTIDLLIKPQQPELASEGALKVIGPLWDRSMQEGLDPKLAFEQFIKFVERVNDGNKFHSAPMLVAYNMPFDYNMITYWFKHYKILKVNKRGFLSVPWCVNQLDLLNMCFLLFEQDPSVNSWKLDSILERLGIERSHDTHHDGMEDVHLESELFIRCMRYMRKCGQRMRVTY